MPHALILYATNSGNTEFTAEAIGQTFTTHHFPHVIQNVADTQPSDVTQYDLIILGCCTWEKINAKERIEGQLQDQMEEFLTRLKTHSLKNKPMAVFGLGDSDYQFFCGAAIILNKFVESADAFKVGTTLYIDSWPQPQVAKINAWTTSVIEIFRTSSPDHAARLSVEDARRSA